MKCEGCFRVVGETTLVLLEDGGLGGSEAGCCHGNRQLGWVRQPSCQFNVHCAKTQSAKVFPDLCNNCFSHNS